ncbi:MAG: long-chain fatty acid--CoA ligase [Lewinellaceae bacterium]|nr:long-chain fatty acid--CoA ligase [Lewinellaceae bacterium]
MDFQFLFELFPYQQARFPNPAALVGYRDGQWHELDTQHCLKAIEQNTLALLRMGLQSGERVALIGRYNCPGWILADLALQQLGLVVVPLAGSLGDEELRFALEDAGVRILLSPEPTLVHRLRELLGERALEDVYEIDTLSGWPSGSSAEPATPIELEEISRRRMAIQPQDLVTLIYTSGTTGSPKGVMLSHHNLVSNLKATLALVPINWEKRALSFLPLSHIFERATVYVYIAVGANVYFGERGERLLQQIQEIKPHYFTTVPLVMERFFALIEEKIRQLPAWKRRIANWAIALGRRFPERRIAPAYALKRFLAYVLVYRHWRRQLGGRVEGVIVGAAALPPALGRLFAAAHIPIREGYGLTETSPVVAFNRFEPGGSRFGTVGIPLPGVEVRIQPAVGEEIDGEILVRGPNVMLGYYRQEEATRAVIDEEGWLHTGDLGRFVHKYFLQITGRRNELFKTASGKFVTPQSLEQHINQSPFILQSMVVGANQPYVGALLVPDFSALEKWCNTQQVHWTAPPFMIHNPRVVQLIRSELDRLNEALSPYQRIRSFHLLDQPWTEETGELTHTLKLRRKQITARYMKEVVALFTAS